jgi:multidrug efflux pump subunit AcrA (membrane-fusion protein)
MNKFVSENGGILAVLAVCAVIGGAYIEWRIDVNVTSKVNAQGAITPDQLALVSSKLEGIKEDVSKLEGDNDRLEDKIDQVIGILLED